MQQESITKLNPNPRNPRTMTEQKAKALADNMQRFGDLAPIIFNVRTNMLVGGHRRIDTFSKILGGGEIYKTQVFQAADAVGTVALGYVIYNGRQFAYREVDWAPEFAEAAGIAANNVQGENDDQLLAELIEDLKKFDNSDELLQATGLAEKELKKLEKLIGTEPQVEPEIDQPTDDSDHMKIVVTPQQSETINQAITIALQNENILGMSDEQKYGFAIAKICGDYIARSPQSETELTDYVDTPA